AMPAPAPRGLAKASRAPLPASWVQVPLPRPPTRLAGCSRGDDHALTFSHLTNARRRDAVRGTRSIPSLRVSGGHADQQAAGGLRVEQQRAQSFVDIFEPHASAFQEVGTVPLESTEARSPRVLESAGEQRHEPGADADADAGLLRHLVGVTAERE